MNEAGITWCGFAGSRSRDRSEMRHNYLSRTMRYSGAAILALMALGACRPATSAPVVTPVPSGPPPLPPMPLVEGPLQPNVVYPRENAQIGSTDSTFILGSVGNGRASLFINGQPVRVWPNGSFLGYIANPPATAPQYDLVAALGSDTARLTRPVKVPGMEALLPDSLRPPPPPPSRRHRHHPDMDRPRRLRLGRERHRSRGHRTADAERCLPMVSLSRDARAAHRSLSRLRTHPSRLRASNLGRRSGREVFRD